MKRVIAAAGLCAMSCAAQDVDVQAVQKTVTEAMEKVRTELAQIQINPEINLQIAQAQADVDRARVRIADQVRVRFAGDRGLYDRGVRELDARRYDEAAREFERAAATDTARADGALYWQAYALNRSGKRDEALAALDKLRKGYPSSRWLDDAKALDLEVRQNSGQKLSPADEANEDLKLMAINSLMNADPERAIPLIEGVLKGTSAPKVKDRALFVLTQNRSPRAEQVLANVAKGGGNPDLQMRAIRYIGMSGTPTAQQQLASIYSGSSDVATKKEVLRALTSAHGRDQIFALAKSEKDDNLRSEAVRQLGAMRATDQLAQLDAGASPETRVEIIRALFSAGATDKIADIAKNEKDVRVRSEAIRHLAMSRQTTTDTLVSMYSADADQKIRREILNALHSRGDAKSLVEIARKESDPVMKRQIVSQLSTMRNSKEATDYMMELLK